MTKLVLLDLDDTLWDTETNNKDSLRQLYTALHWGQYFVSFEEYYTLYIQHNIHLWRLYAQGLVGKKELSIDRLRHPLLPYVQLSDSQWETIDEQYMDYIRRKTLLCPGAIELLTHLRPNYRIAILSNGFGEIQHHKIEHSGIAPWVDRVFLSEEVGCNKPDPKLFAYALEQMGCTAEESVMIGDSWDADIVGACRSGIPCYWYNRWGLEPYAEPSPSTLRATISHLDQLHSYL